MHNSLTSVYFWIIPSHAGDTRNNAPDEPELKTIGDEMSKLVEAVSWYLLLHIIYNTK